MGRVISLRHSGDQPEFRDPARVADIGLKDHGSVLLKNFPEAPLGENAFARGERNMGLLRQFGHDIYVERLHHLFVEPRLIGLQRFDQKRGGGRLHGPVKVDRYIDAGALALPQGFETFRHFVDELLPLDVLERSPRRVRGHFHRR